MGRNSRRIKERAEELLEGYDDAYIEALMDAITDMFGDESYPTTASKEMFDGISADEIDSNMIEEIAAGLTDHDQDCMLEVWADFTFPLPSDWAYDQVDNELADIGDQKYEQMRDERMEREMEND